MTYEELPALADLLGVAKWAFSTRRVNQADAVNMRRDVTSAVSGDLLIGRVLSIGSHARVQLTDGRPSELYAGDLIVAACGARYASDQFEGVARIAAEGADMLAGWLHRHHERAARSHEGSDPHPAAGPAVR